jgi:ribosome biogenesis GTPase A
MRINVLCLNYSCCYIVDLSSKHLYLMHTSMIKFSFISLLLLHCSSCSNLTLGNKMEQESNIHDNKEVISLEENLCSGLTSTIDLKSKLNQLVNQKEIDYQTLKELFSTATKINKELIESSKSKNLILLLGKTGSGKSTLINYLTGKNLLFDEYGDLVLKNPNDTSAAEIGTGVDSTTLLPQLIRLDKFNGQEYNCNFEYFLCDFPGLNDTKGVNIDLSNAVLLKQLVENVAVLHLVFVISEAEIDSGRGESIKQLIKGSKDLVSNEDIDRISSLVVTKTRFESAQKLGAYVQKKCGSDIELFKRWIDQKKISQVRKDGINWENNRDAILHIICNIENFSAKKVQNLNVKSILSDINTYNIEDLFSSISLKCEKEAEVLMKEEIEEFEKKKCLFNLEEEDRRLAKKIIISLKCFNLFENDDVVYKLKNLFKKEYEKQIKCFFEPHLSFTQLEEKVSTYKHVIASWLSIEIYEKYRCLVESYSSKKREVIVWGRNPK